MSVVNGRRGRSAVIVQIVRFRSALEDAEVVAMYEARSARYREVPGLLNKYYLAYPTGEHGAVYVWDAAESLEAFRQGDLARTIPEAYRVQGDPHIEVAEVRLVLRPEATADV